MLIHILSGLVIPTEGYVEYDRKSYQIWSNGI